MSAVPEQSSPKKRREAKFGSIPLSDPPRRLRKNQGLSNILNSTTHLEHYQVPQVDMSYRDPNKKKRAANGEPFQYVISKLLDKGNDASFRPYADPKTRNVPKLSVWAAGIKPQVNNFVSTNTIDYDAAKLRAGSPRQVLHDQDTLRTAPTVPVEVVQQRNEVVNRFRQVVSDQYGNATQMFVKCKKTKEDTVDLEEFANLMLRLNLDHSFPPPDQQTLLASLPQVFGSGVSVSDIIMKIDTAEMLDPKRNNQREKNNRGEKQKTPPPPQRHLPQPQDARVAPAPSAAVHQHTQPTSSSSSQPPSLYVSTSPVSTSSPVHPSPQKIPSPHKIHELSQLDHWGGNHIASNNNNNTTKSDNSSSSGQKGLKTSINAKQRLEMMRTNPHDLSDLHNDFYHKGNTQYSTDQFARYLETTHVKLDEIPFFEKRAEALNWRRFRAEKWEEEASDPRVQERLRIWEENKRKGKESDRLQEAARVAKIEKKRLGIEDEFVHPLEPRKHLQSKQQSNNNNIITRNTGGGSQQYGGHGDNGNDNNDDLISDLGSGVGGDHASPKKGDATMIGQRQPRGTTNAALKLAENATIKAMARKSNHVAGGGDVLVGDAKIHAAASSSSAAANEGTSIGSTEDSYLAAGLGKTNYLYDSSEGEAYDFYPQMPKLFSTKTTLEDPSMILMMEPTYSEPSQHATSKRMAPRDPLDFSRVGVGSNSTFYETKDSNAPGNKKTVWQQSTTSDYFPALIYEASRPVARDLISDSTKELIKKKMTRQARYDRGMANLEETQKRLQELNFDKHVKELFNTKSRNEDAIRYESTVFTNDVRKFRTQPLQEIPKKVDVHASHRMWGGTEGAVNKPRQERDNRDFATTHQSSFVFDQNTLRNSIGRLLIT